MCVIVCLVDGIDLDCLGGLGQALAKQEISMQAYKKQAVASVVLMLLGLTYFLQWSDRAKAEDGSQETWIGVKVLPKEGAVVKDGDQIIYEQKSVAMLNLPWVVQDVKGEWLRVGDHRKGFVRRSDVVTLEKAPAYYTAIINHNPSDMWAVNLRATAWHEKGELDLAIGDYDELLRLDPNNPMAYSNRGGVWADKKEYGRAIADFDQAIRLDPNNVGAFHNRGTVWGIKHNYDQAIADFDQAIRLDPNDAFAYRGRGIAWRAKGEYDRAITDYDQAIRLDPNFGRAYSNRGNLWVDKKKYDKAIADYTEAVRLAPTFAPAFNSVAWLKATCPDARCRDGKAAVKSATKACELTRWSNAYNVGTLGAAYAEAGDFGQAIKWQQKAIDLNSNDAEFVKGGKVRLELYRQKKPYRE
jgi:tetratricopeptide (TPR) repeat protein